MGRALSLGLGDTRVGVVLKDRSHNLLDIDRRAVVSTTVPICQLAVTQIQLARHIAFLADEKTVGLICRLVYHPLVVLLVGLFVKSLHEGKGIATSLAVGDIDRGRQHLVSINTVVDDVAVEGIAYERPLGIVGIGFRFGRRERDGTLVVVHAPVRIAINFG